MINVQKIVELRSTWLPLDTQKMQKKNKKPKCSQQNIQHSNIPLCKRGEKSTPPESPKIVIKELSEERAKVFSQYQ